MLFNDTILTFNDQWQIRNNPESDNTFLLVNRATGYYLEANRTAVDIARFIATNHDRTTTDELFDYLAGIYNIEKSTLVDDIPELIETLRKDDILVTYVHHENRCRTVISDIRTRQSKLESLHVDRFGLTARYAPNDDKTGKPKTLTPGCLSCNAGKWAVMHVCNVCDATCDFCPKAGMHVKQNCRNNRNCSTCEDVGFQNRIFNSFDDLRFQFDIVKNHFNAFAWIGGETLASGVMKKILPMISYFKTTYPDYHQWLYTACSDLDADKMKKLREADISELRINTHPIHDKTNRLRILKEAGSIFPHVCIEVPMLDFTYEQISSEIEDIIEAGVCQLNLAEYMVSDNHLRTGLNNKTFLETQGPLYLYKGFIASPEKSRKLTYDLIERADREKWPLVINDCSNECKYYKLSVGYNSNDRLFDPSERKGNYWENSFRLWDIDRWNSRFKK